MDKSIREKLGEFTEFLTILDFMESTGIEFRDKKLRGVLGIATFYCVYLDISKMLANVNNQLIAHIILHEIGHYKRISKLGKEKVMSNLSIEDFDLFSDSIIEEEMIADRYACFIHYKLRGNSDWRYMQGLDNPSRRNAYKGQTLNLFKVIDNKEENYIKLLESFVEN